MPDPDLEALLGPKPKRASFLAGLDTTPDPLADVEYTDDLATDALAELDAVQQAFRERRKGEDRRFAQATDSEYWIAVCFTDRADKEAFLKASRLTQLGDKYLDGYRAARILGINFETKG